MALCSAATAGAPHEAKLSTLEAALAEKGQLLCDAIAAKESAESYLQTTLSTLEVSGVTMAPCSCGQGLLSVLPLSAVASWLLMINISCCLPACLPASKKQC